VILHDDEPCSGNRAAHTYRSRREYRLVCCQRWQGRQTDRTLHRPRALASRASFVNGRTFCGLAINGALQIVQWQPGRPRYWRNNLKGSDFDPITEIIRNLFRFHLGGRTTSESRRLPPNLASVELPKRHLSRAWRSALERCLVSEAQSNRNKRAERIWCCKIIVSSSL
jgi:hypothetical protein